MVTIDVSLRWSSPGIGLIIQGLTPLVMSFLPHGTLTFFGTTFGLELRWLADSHSTFRAQRSNISKYVSPYQHLLSPPTNPN